MRTILNISLPPETLKQVKLGTKMGKFASTSEFMRHLIRLWNTHRLADELHVEQKEFAKGDYKILRSLKDLKK